VRKRAETVDEAVERIVEERRAWGAAYHRIMVDGARFALAASSSSSSSISSGPHSTAHKWFRVTQDGSELLVEKEGKKSSGENPFQRRRRRSSLLALKDKMTKKEKYFIADISRMRYGPGPGYALRNSANSPPPWLQFAVEITTTPSSKPGLRRIVPIRTLLDLTAATDQQATYWFLGLQALAPLANTYLSKGSLLWHRLRMKVAYFAKQGGMSKQQYCAQLLMQATIEQWHPQKKRDTCNTSPSSSSSLPSSSSSSSSSAAASAAAAADDKESLSLEQLGILKSKFATVSSESGSEKVMKRAIDKKLQEEEDGPGQLQQEQKTEKEEKEDPDG